MDDVLLDDREVAARLGGVSVRWVADQAREGVFPHFKFGRQRRYSLAHLEQIKALCEASGGPVGGGRRQPRPRRRGVVVEAGGGLVAKVPRRLQQVRAGEV